MLVITSFAGCSSSDDGEQGTGSSEGQVTLEVWAMGNEGNRLGEMKEAFEKEHPNIKLNITAIPWDNAHDKLVTATVSQNGPDVVQLGSSWVTEFADAGALLDLTEYDKSEEYPNINSDLYFDGALESGVYEGKFYAVPWYVETRVLYYRADLLAEVGYDEPPKTHEELVDVAQKLVEKNGEGHYGIDLDINDAIYPQIFSWQNGLDLIDPETRTANFDDPIAIETMEWYANFFRNGLAATPEVQIDITQAFAEGIKPMYISGPWMISIMNDAKENTGEFEWDLAVLPSGKVGNTSYLGGAGLGITSYSKNVEEALTFINYMADPEVQVEWYKVANCLPSVISAWEAPELSDDPHLQVFREQLENAKPAPMIVEQNSINVELLNTVERIVVGGADVEEEMLKLDQYAQELLDQK